MTFLAFNAALVIFSSLLICLSEKSYSVQFPFLNLEVYMKDLQRAVESILLLDIGNRMVETCAKYVSRLIQILEELRKWPYITVKIVRLIKSYRGYPQ